MNRTLLVTAALGLALLAGPAPSAPFTSAFDELRTVLEDLDEPTKRQQKAANAFLKKLGKTSTSLKKDIRTCRSVVKLEKRFAENQAVLDAIDGTIVGLRGAVQTRFDEVSTSVDYLQFWAAADKARKFRDSAQGFLDAAAAAETHKLKVRQLGKASAKTEAAQKQADRVRKRSVAGSKFRCPGLSVPALAWGWINAPTAYEVSGMRTEIVYIDGVASFSLVLYACNERKQDYAELRLEIAGEPDVGTYDASSSGASAYMFRDPRTPLSGQFLRGTIEIESRGNGWVWGKYHTGPGPPPLVGADFRARDPFDP